MYVLSNCAIVSDREQILEVISITENVSVIFRKVQLIITIGCHDSASVCVIVLVFMVIFVVAVLLGISAVPRSHCLPVTLHVENTLQSVELCHK